MLSFSWVSVFQIISNSAKHLLLSFAVVVHELADICFPAIILIDIDDGPDAITELRSVWTENHGVVIDSYIHCRIVFDD